MTILPAFQESPAGHRFGMMDFKRLMEATDGCISIELTDSGRCRSFSRDYEWEVLEDSGQIRIRPAGEGDDRPQVMLPTTYDVDWSDIVFFGLYEGDGSKGTFTGIPSTIGFAGAHYSLQRFSQVSFDRFFGDQFDTKWSILDDTMRYFDTGQELLQSRQSEIATLQTELEADDRFELPGASATYTRRRAGVPYVFPARTLDVCAEHMGRQFQHVAEQWDIEFPEGTEFSTTLGPGKGGYEVIQNIKGTSWLMPLWLVIVNTVVDTILANQEVDEQRGGWLRWEGLPEELVALDLDLNWFVRERTNIVDRNGARAFYRHRRVLDDGSVEIGASERHTHTLPATLPLRPFELLMTGFYMAEGGSNKDSIHNLGQTEVARTSLRISFDQTEPRLLGSMLRLFLHMRFHVPLIVKTGSKYNIEMTTIGLLHGSLPMVNGQRGEGNVRSIEVTDQYQQWVQRDYDVDGLGSIRALENTGAGLPRPRFTGITGTANVFLMSLFRDITYRPWALFGGGEEE